MKSAIFASLLLLAACGRAGDPRPPIIRVPLKIDDLSATQTGYSIVLNWTNPARYVDGNPATDTGVVHVFRNNVEIGMVAATAAGQRQSFTVDVRNSVGAMLTFAIQLAVPKASKPSPLSNMFLIVPVDVPGSPRNFQAVVDKGQIVLSWEPPELNAGLVEEYRVQRSDKPAASSVRVPRLIDEEYEAGKAYRYSITAVTGKAPSISGEGSLPGNVAAIDMKPPATPSGLEVERLTDNVVLVRWEQNTERDLKGYQLFRSDRPDPIFTGVPNVYPDAGYVPGRGISYRILAVDISGNPSPISAPTPGP